MADWFVGKASHCSDANGGTTWADGKLTITSLLTVGYADGDRLLAGPGVYRELVTLTAGGATVDNTNTINVTNESTAVTGNGTGWLAAAPPLPVVAGDQLFVGNFTTAGDGVGTASAVFTSAAGIFQAGMEGYMIEIMTESTYIIGTVNAANNITLIDPHHAVGAEVWPAAGGGLTYYVVSGEGPYEIASVDGAAAITLNKPWSGPDLTTIPYEIYRPVYLIGDLSGVETDGVGGKVRITGADANDELRTRADGIDGPTRDYWFIRGFQIDCCSDYGIYLDTCTYITIEDCVFHDCQDYMINPDDSTQITVRRCIMTGNVFGDGIYLGNVPAIDNAQCLFENLYIDCGGIIAINGSGGVSIKNVDTGFCSHDGISIAVMNVGAGVFVRCSQLCNQASPVGANSAFHAAVLGQGISQYNNYWANDTDTTNVHTALPLTNTTYIRLPSLPLLGDGVRWPMVPFFAPSEWEENRGSAGLYPANEDLFGVHNEVAQTRRSWGAQHHYPTKRETTVAYGAFAAAQAEPDAMEQQHYWNVQEDRTYTITVQVYLDASYAGNNPQMTVSQPGETDVTATSTGAKGAWEQLTVSFTTGSDLDWIGIFLKSRNTSALANRSVRWQDLDVR